MLRYLLVDHAVPAMWRSLAAALPVSRSGPMDALRARATRVPSAEQLSQIGGQVSNNDVSFDQLVSKYVLRYILCTDFFIEPPRGWIIAKSIKIGAIEIVNPISHSRIKSLITESC